jgi:transketolase
MDASKKKQLSTVSRLPATTSIDSGNLFNFSIPQLEAKATVIRRHIVTMLAKAGSGHPGGSLSAVEILTTLYFKLLRYRPLEPRWPDRDRFVLSKGHAAPVLYAALAEAGYFPVEELSTLRKLGSRLQGHADSTSTPGVEMSSGAVGMGLSFGIGHALAARLDGKDYKTWVLLGDGECDEGQIWEAAAAAKHFKLRHLIAIVDRNRIQNDGFTKDIMDLEPFAEKWRAFGWEVMEIDGHNMGQVVEALEKAQAMSQHCLPLVIAHTVKGKGVRVMENNPDFHGKAPTPEQLEQALKELA